MDERTGNDVQTIVEERAGVLGFARRHAEGVQANLAKGRLSAELATALIEGVRAFAGDVAIGLHRDGNDPVEVRRSMRPIVTADREGKSA